MAFTRVVTEGGNVVMVGKMGYWEAKLILTPKEVEQSHTFALSSKNAMPRSSLVGKFHRNYCELHREY